MKGSFYLLGLIHMWRNGLIAFLSILFSYMVGLLTMGTWFIWPVGSGVGIPLFILCDVHDLLYLLSILDFGFFLVCLRSLYLSVCEWCLVSRAFGSEFSVFLFGSGCARYAFSV